jgi:hypothetical protein
VQASDAQIQQGLEELGAFELEGYIRVLEDEYLIETLKHILYLCMKYDWHPVPTQSVFSELQSESPFYHLIPVLQVMRLTGTLSQDAQLWTPDSLQIYKQLSKDLFKSKYEYIQHEFHSAFEKLVDLIVPSRYHSRFSFETILDKLAISATIKSIPAYIYFPVSELSYDLSTRLKQMFELKEKWSESELRIYLSDIITEPLQQVLLSHTRRISEEGKVLYMHKLM